MIEEIRGEGELYAGDRLVRRTRYRLSISEGDDSGGGIEGMIELATEGEAIVLSRVEELTLLLDDGCHLTFSLASPEGRIRAHGRLEGIQSSPR